ncbi:type II toxin-antitoxin system HicB family antitoxin [Lachnospiraceae bacterium 48-42]|nr:HicB family protein [Dorea sp.]
MLNLTYLAVLEVGEGGSYSVSFPDLPGCFSYGSNLAEAQRMAEEAASLHVYGMERDGDEIPAPSLNLSRKHTEGNVVMPVTIHPDLYRAKRDNERIKTNITLPAWLKRIAEEQKVNYSRLLETALIDYLQLPRQGGR